MQTERRKSLKEPKRNIRDPKYCNIIEFFDLFISRLYMAEDKINELDDISIEILKTETQRAKNWKKKLLSKDSETIKDVI